ncbi:MAG: dihydroneopterin aldolase [Rikenellaceae bacterium]|jgi:dihydroneopterin aldolase|nr:dihydroneopterin aldolase [Rikenellaceae bacterium]
MKTIGTIAIEEMEFYAFHGCYDTEKRVGNHFRVSLWIEADLGAAAASDRMTDTVNYLEVYETVAGEMQRVSNLLEHVAGRIVEAVYARFPGVEKVTVKVSKLNPPLGGPVGKTSVTLTR